ncbi:response regulator [Zeaxanthinibacter enoshimensis]|uniref:Response regulator receiver domain-containing protein n=1 Tax=Zeaxanthinibacter enoshimensis TaxID=392009 RepID=A0A4V3D3Z2_9FLAO|nr:response regulator [Zeaxanthinibacter enoshimensis]TDQ32351.1 response regulator receiver domain-containing protein [Zeaxanthinibacter enoshimensis]
MNNKPLHIVLADDDDDDRLLFTEALEETSIPATVTTFDNGVDLMAYLINEDEALPDIIFLDLNMPLMNGEECLRDIRNEPSLKRIPIIIYSTSLDLDKVKVLRKRGANYYIQKPAYFHQLKMVLQRSIESVMEEDEKAAQEADFVIK